MHRFFLHSLRSAQLLRDHCGAEFPDIDAAVSNAQAVAAVLCDEGLEFGQDRSDWSLLVADDGGHEVARVQLPGAMALPTAHQHTTAR